MRLVNTEKLSELQNRPSNIRNICILAHVDHGKTTLADSLIASNGIISQRMAGKLRYMDSRKDEQERGITMKSSSIALYYKNGKNEEFLVNLIDSPGHVDFSSEVSTAVRLCDGAVVVVDVVEGVCPQTQVALKQAWLENIRPVLVLNKLDRLILEIKLSPLDAYVHLTQILEQVNAVMASLFTTDVLSKSEALPSSGNQLSDWSDGLEQADDSQLYFSPDQGNVIFASAADGWGFCVRDFAAVYATKLGVKQEVLERTLWGDYYINNKTKRVMKGAQEKAKKCLFVQLVLENLWAVYENIIVRKDKEKLVKMVESLNVKMTARDLRHTDSKVQLQAFCSQWLPLAVTVLDMVCSKLPSPCDITEEKVERLMCAQNQSLDSLPLESQALKSAFLNCSSDLNAPIIVYISKMFALERIFLPQNRPRALTSEEIAQRREQARLRHSNQTTGLGDGQPLPKESPEGGKGEGSDLPPPPCEDDDVFIAFARVFSGCLRKGCTVYVLGPKHDPAVALQKLQQGEEIEPHATLKDLKAGQHITRVTVSELYLMMGRDLECLEAVPAGNVLGIGGLEEHVLKTATLSTEIACPAFRDLQLLVIPILRVALEPSRPADLPALMRGLRLLNQADACVQVMVQETGEHVIVTAGEVHLERCIEDLQQRYAKVSVNVSEPIVPFRETIIPPPIVDMVNEAIQDQHSITKKEAENEGVVIIFTPNKQSEVKLRATPLPPDVTTFLENNQELIRSLDRDLHLRGVELADSLQNLTLEEPSAAQLLGEKARKVLESFRSSLAELFDKAGGEWTRNSVNEIWCFGPRKCGPNILINRIPGHSGRNMWTGVIKERCHLGLLEYDSSFVNGFQMATLAGPLCEEPMMGVAFVVDDWTVGQTTDVNISGVFGPLSGQIMSVVKDGCRKAFQAQPQRLMAAMYSCYIQANAEILGKMYAVLGRRHGRILHGDMTQGSSSFSVEAVLPVVESFLFAPEMRKQTSGLASPQLVFSHWEVIEVDPFWAPRTEEEYLHYGEKADSENRARKYMDAVRRRKGLAVQQQVVQHAEKQRTLGKNK